ncbi:hypothetical protein HZ996_12175 [Cryomorphaceae bacterium]|nr:hypothetical protein HZ996_12175 [Cryomorphaceae bacterium]
MKLRLILLVLGLTARCTLFAQEAYPLNSDRPGQTFASSTTQKGAFLIQAGLDWNYVSDFQDSYQTPIYLRFGAGDRLELNAGITPIFNNVLSPFPTFELGLRYHILRSDQWNITGQFRYYGADGFVLGTLSSYWGQGNISYGWMNGASLNSTVAFVYATSEIGSSLISNGADLYMTLNYGFSIGSKWSGFVEYAAFPTSFNSDNDQVAYQLGVYEGFDLGVAWLVQPDLQLDLFTNFPFQIGSSNGSAVISEAFLSIGASWRVTK